jgi:hypothetical protein
MMKTYTKEELAEILRKHNLWLANGVGGERADLCYANLRHADLRGACLCYANLRHADLRDADLRGADMRGACLRYADLRDADLCGADMRGADLLGADLLGADLHDAENLVLPIACPEKGSFIGWKKCCGDLIVELEICADAKRSSATGRKCRCDKAKVISITTPEGTPVDSAISQYTKTFAYRVGETVSVDDFDDNRWNECAPGIHFFITRQEAVDY